MPYYHITGAPTQYQKADGTLASGYYLKFYASGTTTPISLYSDIDGSGALAKCQLNSSGYPINGSNAVFIPSVNQRYKIALYRNSTDADANTFGNADWVLDNNDPFGFGQSTVVDTLSDLKALNTAVYTHAVTLGYDTKGDAGHGEYYYDSGSSATADDFLVIQPNSGGGRWLLIVDDCYNVLTAGLKGDGATTNTSRWTVIMSSLSSIGGTIYFPPGKTYKGEFAVSINNVTIEAKGATFLGDGANTVLTVQVPGGISVGVTIKGGTVNANGASASAIKSVRNTRHKIEDVKIYDCKSHGWEITGDGVGGGTQIIGENIRIDAHGSRSAAASGISIGGGGVTSTVRLEDHYVTGYATGLTDGGVGTLTLNGIYENGTNAVISTGGGGCYIKDWIESFSGKHYRIGDAETTIIAPHTTKIGDIDAYSAGQFPARKNKILLPDAALLGNVVTPDGGIQWYSTSIGGTITADAPKNLRGNFQIAGAATTATVTFTNTEPDTNYYINVTPVAKSGAPAAGANRVVSVSKTTTGFTVTVEAAPAGATSVNFDWVMVR